MRTLHPIILTMTAALLLAACHTTPTQTDAPKPAPAEPTAKMTTDTHAVKTMEAPQMDALDDPKGVLAQRSVYFDFDSYVVKSEFNPVVTAHSKYLEAHKARKIVIQGNTDERGGSEYNLALGQKRAEAVRKSMSAMGVTEGQMEAVSFGKEKPKADGHDEAAWSQNRRADIVYGPAK
ncbi:MAG TPA: peptidoglycan-associated lipoprotein Pal [Burkholderiaceae bacterium]|jgi:peptidoglycan-associated lipoprotein